MSRSLKTPTTSHGRESFNSRLDAYVKDVKRWFASEKPYLKPSFRLEDVRQCCPLNRSYLSRVFNEGFGESFTTVIRHLRIAEVERMLVEHPQIPVKNIAWSCGFSSASALNRAFVADHDGVTPNVFRRQGGR